MPPKKRASKAKSALSAQGEQTLEKVAAAFDEKAIPMQGKTHDIYEELKFRKSIMGENEFKSDEGSKALINMWKRQNVIRNQALKILDENPALRHELNYLTDEGQVAAVCKYLESRAATEVMDKFVKPAYTKIAADSQAERVTSTLRGIPGLVGAGDDAARGGIIARLLAP